MLGVCTIEEITREIRYYNTLDLFYKIITSTVDVFCIVKGTVDAHVQSWQWFAGGVTFALGLVAAGTLLTRRFLYPNPETVLRSVLPKLRASREVCALIGHKLEPGLFRAYSRYGGTWQWVGPPTIISWKPREC